MSIYPEECVSNLIAANISGKYDFSTKITTHAKLPVTSQSKCEVIFVASRIGDPRNRISQKYSPPWNLEPQISPAPRHVPLSRWHKPQPVKPKSQENRERKKPHPKIQSPKPPKKTESKERKKEKSKENKLYTRSLHRRQSRPPLHLLAWGGVPASTRRIRRALLRCSPPPPLLLPPSILHVSLLHRSPASRVG